MKHFKETKRYYWDWEPIFDRYETIDVVDYCDCCGNGTGTHEEERGVNVIRFDLVKHKKDDWYHMTAVMEKFMLPMIEYTQSGETFLDKIKRNGDTLNIKTVTTIE